ncbi:ATP-binding protein [Streptomyces sp. NPDC003077]|uniref:AAA family ATPase n=1 Tax=Streptomyces sp. NPDC003077 TaxID=3154443 RepID=UPI0033B6CB4B
MLLRFRVENYASLLDEQELSLIASGESEGLATTVVPSANLSVLPVAAIFGANAAGKSNALLALAYMRDVVLDSHRRWLPDGGVQRVPFLLSRRGKDEPSTFITDMVVGGVRYEYGFSVNDECVLEEWLYSYPHQRRRVLFERWERRFRYGDSFAGRRKLIEDIVRPNSLYLSAGASNSHPLLSDLYRWFRQHVKIATDDNYGARLYETIHQWQNRDGGRIERLLRFADLGVESLKLSDQSFDEETIRRAVQAMRVIVPEFKDADALEKDLKSLRRLRLIHRGSDGPVPLHPSFESSGTRTWAGLLGPIVSALDDGGVLVIDELDARLHPHLAARLIGLFQDPKINRHGAQLIFNTHDATLLAPHSEARLRRDQVWVAEKDAGDKESGMAGATQLIPLIEYRPRDRVENLEKRYLAGRYGGVPYFDDELIEDLASVGRE